VCSIEKCGNDYRLRVEHGADVQNDEPHSSIHSARLRAEALRHDRVAMGWADAPIRSQESPCSHPSLDDHGQPRTPPFNRSRRFERDISELLGLAKGVLADGVVTEPESKHLGEWILAHPDSWNSWPVQPIAERLLRIFADGVVEDDERQDLCELLHSLVGGEAGILVDEEGRGVDAATRLPLDDPPPTIAWPGCVFVFTGKFAFGTRECCEREVTIRGGICESNVTERTRYLVIGTFGSRDWVQTSFGRKIERAVQYRERGVPIAIMAEEHWAAALARPMGV
jgi:hypothetical protein